MYESSLKHWSPAILENIRCLPFYHFGHTTVCPNVLGMWELNMSATFTRLCLMIQAVMTFYELILLCDGPSDETCCTKARDKPCIQHTAPPQGIHLSCLWNSMATCTCILSTSEVSIELAVGAEISHFQAVSVVATFVCPMLCSPLMCSTSRWRSACWCPRLYA